MSALSDDETMDARTAAVLMRQTQQHAREALQVKLPPLYAAWGTAWLAGLGGMWLSVRGQQPYRGPGAVSVIILAVLILAAILVTMIIVTRATRGIEGASALQGRIYGLAWPIGFAALFTIEGALAQHGASAEVQGVLGAAGPLLVTGLIYLIAAAIWLDWSMFALGAWLALVAAAGAWAGPVTALLLDALAGGGGFLLVAAFLARRDRQ
jgi:hypothetical protein